MAAAGGRNQYLPYFIHGVMHSLNATEQEAHAFFFVWCLYSAPYFVSD